MDIENKNGFIKWVLDRLWIVFFAIASTLIGVVMANEEKRVEESAEIREEIKISDEKIRDKISVLEHEINIRISDVQENQNVLTQQMVELKTAQSYIIKILERIEKKVD